jgi:hypothetical protein
MLARLRRLAARAPSARPKPLQSERASSPSPGFLGERLYYRDSRGRRVEAICVDVSTDWVPLYDIEVKEPDKSKIVESISHVRGYTALRELVVARGWERREQLHNYGSSDADSPT